MYSFMECDLNMECIYELFPDKDIKRIFTTIVDGVEKTTIKFEDGTEEDIVKEGVPYYDDESDVSNYEDEWSEDNDGLDEDSEDELLIDEDDEELGCEGEYDGYIGVWDDEEVESFFDDEYEDGLCCDEKLDRKKMLSRTIIKQKIVRQNGDEEIKTYYSYGPSEIVGGSDTLLYDRFFEITRLLRDNKADIHERINALENSFIIMRYMAKYDSLSVNLNKERKYKISCIDELNFDCMQTVYISKSGPLLYLLLGRFKDAERCAKEFMSLNAYGTPEIEEAVMRDIQIHKKYISRLVSFIKDNPGFYQRNIYKTLTDIPKDWLIECLYYIKLLNRIPYKNSYHLYLNDEIFNSSDCKDVL